MAHPWLFESNFEAGSNAEWDTETDTGSLLDFPHYSTLAKLNMVPYRGAYCARIVCGDTNDHTLTEGDIDIADDGTAYFRWYMYVSNDFTATADDTFNIFELQQAGGTVEMSVGFRITASSNLLEIGIGDGTAPTSFTPFTRGKWTCVELLATVATGGTGAMTLYINGSSVVALTTLTQAAAVGQGVLGTQNTLSTTTGTILLDQFVMDDGRIYPFKERWPAHLVMTKSQHVFVGPGDVEGAVVLSADGTLTLYDTDTANILDELSYVTKLDEDTQTSMSGPVHFERGCYAVVAGSDPLVAVYLSRTNEKPGIVGPVMHWSEGAIKRYGNIRKPRPQDV
jgi:hypothetical protein